MDEMSGNGDNSGSWNSTVAIGKLWGMSCVEVDGGDLCGHKGFGSNFRLLSRTNFARTDVNRSHRESPGLWVS